MIAVAVSVSVAAVLIALGGVLLWCRREGTFCCFSSFLLGNAVAQLMLYSRKAVMRREPLQVTGEAGNAVRSSRVPGSADRRTQERECVSEEGFFTYCLVGKGGQPELFSEPTKRCHCQARRMTEQFQQREKRETKRGSSGSFTQMMLSALRESTKLSLGSSVTNILDALDQLPVKKTKRRLSFTKSNKKKTKEEEEEEKKFVTAVSHILGLIPKEKAANANVQTWLRIFRDRMLV